MHTDQPTGTTATCQPDDDRRLRVVLCSVGISVGYAFVCSRWAGSDGRSAVALNLANLAWFGGCAIRRADRTLGKMLLAAAAFGAVELLADDLCVRCTRTLDYSVAGSTMLLASPWWMPCSWAVVAVQTGVPGAAAIRRLGRVRGALLTGGLAALLIPFYEEMAWGAHWWRYRDCLRIGHTPVYIVLAEAVIGAGLASLGFLVWRGCSARAAGLLGLTAGLVTILGGVLGWGAVEFLGRGARPAGLSFIPGLHP